MMQNPALNIEPNNTDVQLSISLVGKDGRTPVKGKDYWTAADKQEIINDVTQQIGGTQGNPNSVLYVKQDLTREQKEQARFNLDVMSIDDIHATNDSIRQELNERINNIALPDPTASDLGKVLVVTTTGENEDGEYVYGLELGKAPVDSSLTMNGIAADAAVVGEKIAKLDGDMVKSVNGKLPDENGNIALTAENVNAYTKGEITSIVRHIDDEIDMRAMPTPSAEDSGMIPIVSLISEDEDGVPTYGYTLTDLPSCETDNTLSVEGVPADAAAVGTRITQITEEMMERNANGAWITRKPFVTFTADDGYEQDITILEPIFKKYNVPCCVAMVSTSINNLDKRLDLQNNHGWEVICHSNTSTPFTSMASLEEVESAMVESKATLEGMGFTIKDVAYPSGGCNSAIKQIAKKHFRAGYEFNPHPSVHLNTGILDSYSILRVPLGSFTYAAENATLEYYKSCVDNAVANNGWAIFCLHAGAADFDATQQQHLDDLIAYIQSIGVEIGNLSAGYEIFGNYIECGPTYDVSVPKTDVELSGFKVANSGENNLPIQHLKDLIHTSNDPMTAYPLNKISVTETGHFNAGFPLNCGGTLITSRFTNFSFQIWLPYIENQVFRRTWNAGAWRPWQKISAEPTSDSQISRLWQLRELWSDNVAITINSRLFIRTLHINGGVTATLTKQYFALSDISTDRDNPTVIGTTSDGMEIHMVYQTNGYLLFKYSGTTSHNPAYVEIAYA